MAFNFLFQVLFGLGLMILGYLLMPKPPKPKPPEATDLEGPTAEAGRPIPVIFGHIHIQSPNFLWYGDINHSRHKKDHLASAACPTDTPDPDNPNQPPVGDACSNVAFYDNTGKAYDVASQPVPSCDKPECAAVEWWTADGRAFTSTGPVPACDVTPSVHVPRGTPSTTGGVDPFGGA